MGYVEHDTFPGLTSRSCRIAATFLLAAGLYPCAAQPTDYLRVALMCGNGSDEAVVHFVDGATAGFDDQADSYKLPVGGYYVYFPIAGDVRLAVNSLPPFGCTQQVPLGIGHAAPGHYVLRFSDYDSFAGSAAIELTDHFLHQQLDILSGDSYAFEITSDPASGGANRFGIMFTRPIPSGRPEMSAVVDCSHRLIRVSLNKTSPNVYYSCYTMDGLLAGPATRSDSVVFLISIDSTDIDRIIVRATDAHCSERYSEFTLDVEGDCDDPGSPPDQGADNRLLMLYPNPSVGTVTVGLRAPETIEFIQVLDASGGEAGSGNAATGTVNLNGRPPGVYLVHVKTANGEYRGKVVKE